MSEPARKLELHSVPEPIPFERLVDKRAVADALGVSVSWVEKRCLAAKDPLPSVRTKAGRRMFRLSACVRWYEEG